jgi:hypothetical protein
MWESFNFPITLQHESKENDNQQLNSYIYYLAFDISTNSKEYNINIQVHIGQSLYKTYVNRLWVSEE